MPTPCEEHLIILSPTTRTSTTKKTLNIALVVRRAGEQAAARSSQLCQRLTVFFD